MKFETWADMPPMAVSMASMEWNRTGGWGNVRPLYRAHVPPCRAACPAGERIPEYFARVREGRLREAWEIILEDNPLPGVCARVCPHFCEAACNRGQFDERVAVHGLERFVADAHLELEASLPPLEGPKAHRVAVVGSGPAGLSCAWQLVRRGYAVTVFEKHARAGGMLRVGIPAYRLPREVLDKEIADIVRAGVEIRTGTPATRDDLAGFDAVCVATGASTSRRLGIPGEDSRGVQPALDFLLALHTGSALAPVRRVAVIGGGNTAMDAARCALRLGAQVTVVYRRSRASMPALPDEIAQAGDEGVRFLEWARPVRIIEESGRVAGLACQGQRAGPSDEGGRPTPVDVPGEESVLRVDGVLVAVGESADTSLLRLDSHPRLFPAGDVSSDGAATVVSAIGSGKRAALAIHHALSGVPPPPALDPTVSFQDIRTAYFRCEARASIPQTFPADRVRDFSEVEGGLAQSEALDEAGRCFSCGVCTRCDNCLIFCPDAAIVREGRAYRIDGAHCKGCGICVTECPRHAMELERV